MKGYDGSVPSQEDEDVLPLDRHAPTAFKCIYQCFIGSFGLLLLQQ